MSPLNRIAGIWNDPRSTLPAPSPLSRNATSCSDDVLLWVRFIEPEAPEDHKECEMFISGRYHYAEQEWDVFMDIEDPVVIAWCSIDRPEFTEPILSSNEPLT